MRGLVAAAVLAGVLTIAPAAAAAPADDALVAASATFDLNSNSEGGAYAVCPPGTRALGGGADITSTTTSSIVEVSGPVDETLAFSNTQDGDVAAGWFAEVFNGSASQRTYKVFAICSASSDAVVHLSSPLVFSGGGTADAFATCPNGSAVTGGGVMLVSGPIQAEIEVSVPVDETATVAGTEDGDTAVSWYGSVLNFNDAKTYRVAAMCSSNSATRVEVADPFTLSGTGQEDEATASCPTGSRATGGGIGTTGATGDGYLAISAPRDDSNTTDGTASGDVATGWHGRAVSRITAPRSWRVLALCAGAAGAGDSTAPDTQITKRPKDKLKTRRKKAKAEFEFSSSEPGTFECSLDGGAFATCTSPHTVSVKKGGHTFEVRAVDQAGNVGAPASDDWKVKKKR